MTPQPSNRVGEPANARSRRTRAALLAATRALLEEDGFEALTMAAVAKRAGCSRRAVYLHFASRSELVAALFDHVTEAEGLAASTARVWAAPDAAAALDEWARHLARYHPGVIAVGYAVERVKLEDPDAAKLQERVERAQLARCRRLAEWLEREDRLASPWTVQTATDMLFALISTDMIERLLERRWSRRRLGDRISLLLRSTFLRDPEPAHQAAGGGSRAARAQPGKQPF
jgi:AcrR family transcriptional regulator